ncbi:MAG: glycoside hydrolase family 2 protein [Armatimonadota bacterium]
MSARSSAAVPRPEHPRPDYHRGLRHTVDWLNLNGHWEFEFDPDGSGIEEGWHEPDGGPFSRLICVPFPWESHLAWGTQDEAGNESWFSPQAWLEPESVGKHNYREAPRHTVGWYRRRFTCPAGWGERRVFLNVGAADWELRAWVNGIEVGAQESGYLPISFDITDALSAAENTLVIRVHDPEDHSQQPVGKQVPSWYTRTSGIWQTVWLEPRSAAHLTEVHVQPSLARRRAQVAICAAVPERTGKLGAEIQIRTAAGSTVACVGPLPVDERGEARLEAAISAPIPWTPDAPHLYRLEARLLEGDRVVDIVHTQFGMRDVDCGPLGPGGPVWIRLNGEPVYLRGALDQSFHPQGVYTHPSNAAIRRDLMLARQAGLNFLRLHIKTPDPRYCYWADRVGVLLMCDIPNFGYDGYSDLARQRWERNAWGQIRRDFNHPSIIAWCLFNESWGLGGREYAQSCERQQWVRECYQRAKQLDPTRLVEDNSACLYDHVATDINSWHFYINDYERAREHIAHVVEETYPGSPFNFVGGNRQGEQPLLNSEYGGISARMGDLDVSWCLLFLTNELRKHEKICGYVYTELTDIEWECNGLWNYDRTPKQFGYDPALILGELFVGLDCAPGQSVAPGQAVRIPVFLRPALRAAELAPHVRWWASFTDGLGRERVIVRPRALNEIAGDGGEIALTVPDQRGLVRLQAELSDGHGGLAAMNLRFLEVVEDNANSGSYDLGVLRLAAGEGEARFDGPIERGQVGGRVHLLAGQGDGEVSYVFALPEGIDASAVASVTVSAELSSAREGTPQTDDDRWPSRVRIFVAEHEAARVRLPDQPADTRGALSHMHGFAGRYGELVRASVSGEAARAAVEGGAVRVRLVAEAASAEGGGLTVYSSRAGRYPCDVTLTVRTA